MFFRILLIIILIYIIVGFFKRLFASPKSTNSQYQNTTDFTEEKEGNITIKDNDSKKQKINKAEGDYVDFEDV